MINNKKRLFLMIMMAARWLIGDPSFALDVDLGDSLIRDYHVSLPLPGKYLELGMDGILMNNTIDIFNVKENDFEASDFNTLNETVGVKLYLNYGITDYTTLKSSFHYTAVDLGDVTIKIKGLELAVQQVLLNRRYGWLPLLTIEGGIRFNYADDIRYQGEKAINTAFQKFDPALTLKMDEDSVHITRKTDSSSQSYEIPRDNNPEPEIIQEDIYDTTPYVCLTAGRIIGNLFPNVFAEIGRIRLSSALDFNLKSLVSKTAFPVTTDRNETYVKAGMSLLWKFPYSAMAHLEYSYLKLLGEGHTDTTDNNHIVRADINYFITRNLIINFGSAYYHRQYIGVIPFFYNDYPAPDGEQRYATIHLGFTWLFGK